MLLILFLKFIGTGVSSVLDFKWFMLIVGAVLDVVLFCVACKKVRNVSIFPDLLHLVTRKRKLKLLYNQRII